MNYFCFINILSWKKEITEYLHSVIGENDYNVFLVDGKFKYSFSREEDLVAFKLRFKEAC